MADGNQNGAKNGVEDAVMMEPETFANWTGDQMHTSNDLVYKLALENTTEMRIIWKISLES